MNKYANSIPTLGEQGNYDFGVYWVDEAHKRRCLENIKNPPPGRNPCPPYVPFASIDRWLARRRGRVVDAEGWTVGGSGK